MGIFGENKEEAFLKACERNDIEKVKKIIKKSQDYVININKKNDYGNNPLLYACGKNNIEIVQLLIDYANKNNIILELNEKDKDGNYPLLYACYKNNIEMVQLFINYVYEKILYWI